MDGISLSNSSGTEAAKVKEADAAALEKEEKLKQACADFESILVFELLKTMRKTIPQSGLLGNSIGKETFEMMLDQKLANDMVNKGLGFGLQGTLYQQLTRHEEKND